MCVHVCVHVCALASVFMCACVRATIGDEFGDDRNASRETTSKVTGPHLYVIAAETDTRRIPGDSESTEPAHCSPRPCWHPHPSEGVSALYTRVGRDMIRVERRIQNVGSCMSRSVGTSAEQLVRQTADIIACTRLLTRLTYTTRSDHYRYRKHNC